MKIFLSVKFGPGTKHPISVPYIHKIWRPRSRTRRLGLRCSTNYYVPLLRSTLRTPSASFTTLPLILYNLTPSLFQLLYVPLLPGDLLSCLPFLFACFSPSLLTYLPFPFLPVPLPLILYTYTSSMIEPFPFPLFYPYTI